MQVCEIVWIALTVGAAVVYTFVYEYEVLEISYHNMTFNTLTMTQY